ncbi:MAG: porin family protein [Rhizobiales bacterium]|nr:porin family protein [Hyphomicrobiales bacterium]
MKSSILAIVATLAGVAAAQAADLPRRSAPYAPAPAAYQQGHNWTGFYAGVNAGYGWAKHKGPLYGNESGGMIGGTVGYNQQLSNNIVVGVEGDLGVANVRSTGAAPGPVKGSTKVTSLATVRGRVGYAVDRALVYGTAGYAGGNVKAALADTPNGLNFREERWHHGYALGAGLEYAFTNNVSAKAEYIYANLGKKTYFGGPDTMSSGTNLSTVRGGVNYKF